VGHATLLSKAFNVGTVGYMAPEQNGAARASVRMDVYSLGRVLHYLLKGGHSEITVAYEPTVRSELGATPPALVGLVLRSCHMSPEARPASVAELLRELGAVRAAPSGVEPRELWHVYPSVGVEEDAQQANEPPVVGWRTAARRPNPGVTPPMKEVVSFKPPSVVAGAAQAGTPAATANVLAEGATQRVMPAQGAVSPPPQPIRTPEAPPPTQPIFEPTTEAPAPREALRSSAPVTGVIPDSTGPDVEELEPVELEWPPPSSTSSWRGLGAMVVILSAVSAWVKFGGIEPAVGPCGVPLLGAPTGDTYEPKVAGLDMPFVGLSDGQFCMGSIYKVGDDISGKGLKANKLEIRNYKM
jgi:hypothetical protein